MTSCRGGAEPHRVRRDPGVEARSLADLPAFNEHNADTETPYFGQERLIAAESKGPHVAIATDHIPSAVSQERRVGPGQ